MRKCVALILILFISGVAPAFSVLVYADPDFETTPMCYVAYGAPTTIGGGTHVSLLNSSVVAEATSGVKTEFKYSSRDHPVNTTFHSLPNAAVDHSYFYLARTYTADTEISGLTGNIIIQIRGITDKKADGTFRVTLQEYNPTTDTHVYTFGSALGESWTSDSTTYTANITFPGSHVVSAGNKLAIKVEVKNDDPEDTDFEYKLKIGEYKANSNTDTAFTIAYGDSFGADVKNWLCVIVNEAPASSGEKYNRAVSQIVTISGESYRVCIFNRIGAQEVVIVPNANRLWGLSRIVSQGTSLTFSGERTLTAIRALTQQISPTFNGDRFLHAIRTANQNLSATFESGRTWVLSRSLGQSLSFTSNVFAEVLGAIYRAVGMQLSVTTDSTRSLNMTRVLTQTLSFTPNAWGEIISTIIRKVSLSLSVTADGCNEYGTFSWGILDIAVKTLAGQPVENAVISAWQLNGTDNIGEVTNAMGFIPAQNLTKGKYAILVIKEGYQDEMWMHTLKGNQLITMSLHSVEEAIMFNIELLIFVVLGCTCLYIGYTTKEIGNKIVANFGSLIFWIAAMYQWIVSNPNSFSLVITFLAPFLWGFTQGMHALGEHIDRMGGKPSRYE